MIKVDNLSGSRENPGRGPVGHTQPTGGEGDEVDQLSSLKSSEMDVNG